MEPRLVQHQSQKFVLSPQIRQYLKLLQLPAAELEQAIELELVENPLLEEKVSEPVPDDPAALEDSVPEERKSDTAELEMGDSFEHLSELDENFQESFEYPDMARPNVADTQKRRNFQETTITKRDNLAEYLLWQIGFLDLAPEESRIVQDIVGNVDEDGYLKASLDEIAAAGLHDTALVKETLQKIQGLDPPGVAAANLQETLLLQLSRKNDADRGLASEMVRSHLDLVKKRDWLHLAKLMNEDLEKVKRAAELITNLEPRPGRIFYADETIAVSPDVLVSFSEEEDGKLHIEIPEETLPSLRINPYYRRLIKGRLTDEQTKIFLRERLTAAMNFIKALSLRKSTLREITEEIVKAQPEFFEKGFSHLRPLRLKDISSKLGIHESTVSRALQNKYIATPQGTIPFKSFFSTKLESLGEEDESQKSVMEKMRKMVAEENVRHPLSDQAIEKCLRGDGIQIARRTIAKYRELLKILPSHLRRKK